MNENSDIFYQHVANELGGFKHRFSTKLTPKKPEWYASITVHDNIYPKGQFLSSQLISCTFYESGIRIEYRYCRTDPFEFVYAQWHDVEVFEQILLILEKYKAMEVAYENQIRDGLR